MARTARPWYRSDRRAWFVTIDGKRHNLGPNRKTALRRFHELMSQPRRRVITTDSLLALIDLFLDWCQKHRAADTYEWYRYRLERFAQQYPDLRAAELKPYHVQEWIDAMDLSNGSKRNYGGAVKRCIRWATKQGYIDTNPIEGLELPRAGKREHVIGEGEWETVLSLVPDPCFRDLLAVTWETGCRPQESLRVEARHVDHINQRWVFPASESKTERTRIVYLTDDAFAITKRLMNRYPAGALFRNSRGKPWTTSAVNCAFIRIQIRLGQRQLEEEHSNLSKNSRNKYRSADNAEVRALMEKLSPTKQSGVKKTNAELHREARRKLAHRNAKRKGPKYSLYTLRHSWVNRLLTRGVDALTVAHLAGHHGHTGTIANSYAHLTQAPEYLLKQAKKAAS